MRISDHIAVTLVIGAAIIAAPALAFEGTAVTGADAAVPVVAAQPNAAAALKKVTVMVQNSRGVPPPAATPFFTACAWRISEILQGAASFQQEATPTKGWRIWAVVRPMA